MKHKFIFIVVSVFLALVFVVFLLGPMLFEFQPVIFLANLSSKDVTRLYKNYSYIFLIGGLIFSIVVLWEIFKVLTRFFPKKEADV